ncbi:hypothetical protein HYH03_009889 [Edaphochlamys debaryana]|uniref:Uncharacterized protein n=1 Tax=Edaphochlamys debaryana TaxID=47281 RepID=A0A836BWH7_9CHLO|nr:hypothetical protein HYH03_009889 [Edaphochlamys debaryana]|eukprot:KAG2491726.1 hypothetical protein HYH03_009889 [Edaphochlamys debaryana]
MSAQEQVVDEAERIRLLVKRLRGRGELTDAQKQALAELKDAVEGSTSAAEEAQDAGAVALLTRLLGLTDDEETLDAASAVIAACSGHMAAANKVSTSSYGPATVCIREAALGDGLGARVWLVAHTLCAELAEAEAAAATAAEAAQEAAPEAAAAEAGAGGAAVAAPGGPRRPLLRGQAVLELGSGCGVCGLAAAQLGAARVVLSDVEGPVLRNLAACLELNAAHLPPAPVAPAPSPQGLLPGPREEEAGAEAGAEVGASGSAGEQPAQGGAGPEAAVVWERGNACVRLLDWAEAVEALDGPRGAGEGQGGQQRPCASDPGPLPPRVPLEERFPVIIGSEVMYELAHAELVAAVLAHRLAPGGCAVLSCAVRELKVFAHFAVECRRRGLRYRRRQVPVAQILRGGSGSASGSGSGSSSFQGVLGRLDCYEGGFLVMAIDRADAPCASWYRSDWEEV